MTTSLPTLPSLEQLKRQAKDLVKRFKAHRQEQGLSHEVLARKAGITRPAVSHIEGGKRNPTLMVALRIAHAAAVGDPQIAGRAHEEYADSREQEQFGADEH